MTANASDLLRALGAGIRPAAPDRAAAPGGVRAGGTSALEHAAFADLLAEARAGDVSSSLPVSIAPGAGIELTPEQLDRVAAAADRAEASGATRALVLIDGMSLRLDVGVRTITGAADLTTSGVLTGIDAVLHAPPAPGGVFRGGPNMPGMPSAGHAVQNASLLRTLADAKRT